MPIQLLSNSGVLTCEGQARRRSVNPIARQLDFIAEGVSQFFFQKFGLNGVDGRGKIPSFSIGWDPDNAAWVCPSGYTDENCVLKFHNRRTINPKVVAHEYTHAIIAHLGKLTYFGQSGALSESICDIMAIGYAFPFFSSERAIWNITNCNFMLCSKMSNFKTFTRTSPDHGYVHYNSQIPSHAFYHSVRHCDRLPDGRIASVWFNAIRFTTHDETFSTFAVKTIVLAVRHFDPFTAQVIANGWLHVEVLAIQIHKPLVTILK